jgi:hypothetical protein
MLHVRPSICLHHMGYRLTVQQAKMCLHHNYYTKMDLLHIDEWKTCQQHNLCIRPILQNHCICLKDTCCRQFGRPLQTSLPSNGSIPQQLAPILLDKFHKMQTTLVKTCLHHIEHKTLIHFLVGTCFEDMGCKM